LRVQPPGLVAVDLAAELLDAVAQGRDAIGRDHALHGEEALRPKLVKLCLGHSHDVSPSYLLRSRRIGGD
jgi:hypothetical protein